MRNVSAWLVGLLLVPCVATLSTPVSSALEVVREPLSLSLGQIHCSAVLLQQDRWFLGTDYGVYRSRASGQGWEFASEGLQRTEVSCLHVVPEQPGWIYAALHD